MAEHSISADGVAAVERIAREAERGSNEVKTVEIDGHTYIRGNVTRVEAPDPRPDAVELTTLQGLVDFVNDDADEDYTKGRRRFVVIDSPESVSYCTGANGPKKDRVVLAVASAVVPNLLACVRPMEHLDPRVTWTDPETFIVSLAVLFAETTRRNQLAALLSAIKWEQQQSVADDGFTMVYATRAGIVLGDDVTGDRTLAKNPWQLQAYRTFAEVDQPPADFILRTRGGATSKQVALFEVGDGLWRKAGIAMIRSFLDSKMPEDVKAYG